MLRAASVPIAFDLRPLLGLLQAQGLGVRVTEEAGEQVIWAASESQADQVRKALDSLERGELNEVLRRAQALNEAAHAARPSGVNTAFAALWRLAAFLRRSPLTACLAIACLCVALLSRNGRELVPVLGLFFAPIPFSSFSQLLLELASPANFLRSLTPALLHFGELHLVFNLLWLFYFGTRLEKLQSPAIVLLLYVITAFIGNVLQYYFSMSNAFGGLSGLVYGLVGYCWLLGVVAPKIGVSLRASTFFAFAVALVAMELFAGDSIASAAHLGGLLAGLAYAAAIGLHSRLTSG